MEPSTISRSSTLVRAAIAVDGTQAELAVAAWELAGVYNSSVEYLLEETTEEPWPGHDNRTERAEVAAYLPAQQWHQLEPAARDAAADLLGSEPLFSVKRLPDRDWRTAWHDHFDIVRVPGPTTIVIRPPHKPHKADADELVIDLVPGLAFGTGQHQSTRLCLRLLSEQIRGGERVLDVGTGSGILAVAAAKLGAAAVTATDIDPLAVDAARQTARRNGLAGRIDVREASIPDGERYDLVIANLTADLLQLLAADLVAALGSGGRLIVSGLIEPRLGEVRESLEGVGLELLAVEPEDDWRGMLFSKSRL
ncbi:MAG: methyltransferase [Chloroflexi bacterium]|nr:methyltransferase [Chloroflexota bacterium]MYD17302.1 methyltransferase [Chloroflexota bacterium]MYJ01677.1 methyltransferase [Chloroflexota bacterium]